MSGFINVIKFSTPPAALYLRLPHEQAKKAELAEQAKQAEQAASSNIKTKELCTKKKHEFDV